MSRLIYNAPLAIYHLQFVFLKLHIRLAPLARVIPAERSLHSCTWIASRLQQIKCNTNRFVLHRHIIRFPARIAKRKIAKHKARYTTLFHNIACRSNHNRWDTVCFQMAGCQAHGLMANRSQRNQQRHINIIFATQIENQRRMFCFGHTLAKLRRHTIKTWRQTPNAPVCNKFIESIHR